MRGWLILAMLTACSDGSVRRNVVPTIPEVIDPCIEVAPGRLNFDDAGVPTQDAEVQEVTILNVCEGLLDVLSLEIDDPTAPFDIGRIDSPRLAYNESVEFGVAFAPTASGRFTAQLEVYSNDPEEPRIIVRLIGNGTE
ncbi:MAG: hypothetical protein ACI9MC_002962 [Kiritimatiellia bacterium]